MKNSKTVLLPLIALLLLLAIACKKKGSPGSSEGPEVLPVTPTAPTNPGAEVKALVPLSISTNNLKIDFQYATTGNFLTEIRQSNDSREMIFYNDKNQLKEYKRYLKDELLYHVYYVLNNEGLVSKGIQYTVEAGGKLVTPIGFYQVSYNKEKQIETVDWYDFKNMLIETRDFSYNEKALFAGSKTSGTKAFNKNYLYDDRSGIFKQVPLLQILSLEHEEFYILNVKANVKSIKIEGQPAGDLNFEMQYNANGYPTTITQTDAVGKSKIYKISYQSP
jgi:hypothetical protein